MRQLPMVLIVMMLMAGWVPAQRPAVVEARMVLATDGVRAGSTAKAAVVAEISPGFHINDNKPTLDYLIPTELKLDPVKEVTVTKVVYPKGELKSFAFSDSKLSVYEGTLDVGALLAVSRSAKPGTYTLKGKLAYQACNDHACLPPTGVPVTLAVKVVPRGASLKSVNADVFARIKFN
jgi:thiol:disulfide interchange protein DsbD